MNISASIKHVIILFSFILQEFGLMAQSLFQCKDSYRILCWGEVWEVVVEVDMCRRAVVGMVD